MARINTWIDYITQLSNASVDGSIYPTGEFNSYVALVVVCLLLIWLIVQILISEQRKLSRITLKNHQANDYKKNIPDW